MSVQPKKWVYSQEKGLSSPKKDAPESAYVIYYDSYGMSNVK
jgi:hypothetical protein